MQPTPPAFARLGLAAPILRALAACNHTTPTPIQERAIPPLLDGRDLLGIAQTGTGKTAAFALPILQYLHEEQEQPQPRQARVLVLAPTRELASQIVASFRTYGANLPLRHEVVYGGVGMTPQIRALARGTDVLVATPGRLLDLIGQRKVDLSAVEILVLDEADRMLDMGFVRDVERILAQLPRERQSLLFSATMPDSVARLAKGLLYEPETVAVTPPAATTERVEQHVCFVEQSGKRELLAHLLTQQSFGRTLVFTRTKHGADRVVKHLDKDGIAARAIHGNKSQNQRERALEAFRNGQTLVLVATDLAARGIDVADVTHVVNFDLPDVAESYVHRIGRTARAGREGVAISFCSQDECDALRAIEKLIRKRVPVLETGRGGAERARPTRPAEPQDRATRAQDRPLRQQDRTVRQQGRPVRQQDRPAQPGTPRSGRGATNGAANGGSPRPGRRRRSRRQRAAR
ncbi:MAG: DEAD/DEAH box helicase [Planctomycetota bacterium]